MKRMKRIFTDFQQDFDHDFATKSGLESKGGGVFLFFSMPSQPKQVCLRMNFLLKTQS
jgi:hypothetical protein